jgi:branched-chain amino acid transport system permease protein
MVDHARANLVGICVLAALLLAPLVLAWMHAGHEIGTLTRIAIFGLAAAGLDLVLGYGGMVSFGHAAFLGLGAYTVAILAAHGVTAGLIVLPASMLVGAISATLIGALCLRTSGVQFIMITLAFAQMLSITFNAMKAFGGSDGVALAARNALPGIDVRDETVFYYVCVGLCTLYVLVLARIVDSPFGMVVRGARSSPQRMAAIGLRVYPYQVAAFALSGAGAGLAGGLLANLGTFVSPDVLAWTRSGDLLMMVILGGMGTLLGPVVGAGIFVGLESVLTAATEHWMLIFGAFLVLFVAFRRRGVLDATLYRRNAP